MEMMANLDSGIFLNTRFPFLFLYNLKLIMRPDAMGTAVGF